MQVKNDSVTDFKVGDDRCSACQRVDNDRCFCHPVTDSECLEETRVHLQECFIEAMDFGHLKLDATQKHSRLLVDPRQSDELDNELHIEFERITPS